MAGDDLPTPLDTSCDIEIARALAEDEERLSELHGVFGEAEEEAGEHPVLAMLEHPLQESVCAALHGVLGDAWWEVTSAQWSVDWAGWGQLLADVTQLRAQGAAVFSAAVLERTSTALRQFVRLAAQNEAAKVTWTSDEAALRRLRATDALFRGTGQVDGNNECCADSLLQLLMALSILPVLDIPQRREACAACRRHLVEHPDERLRPRRRDAFSGVDEGACANAFLQHDVHGEAVIRFFLEYFRDRVLRQVPAGGLRLLVHSRFDSEHIPPAAARLCQEDHASEDSLAGHLYNSTGDGISGYHYDQLFTQEEALRMGVSHRVPPAAAAGDSAATGQEDHRETETIAQQWETVRMELEDAAARQHRPEKSGAPDAGEKDEEPDDSSLEEGEDEESSAFVDSLSDTSEESDASDFLHVETLPRDLRA